MTLIGKIGDFNSSGDMSRYRNVVLWEGDSKVELGIQEIYRKCLGRPGAAFPLWGWLRTCENEVGRRSPGGRDSDLSGEVVALPICKNNCQVQVSLLCSDIGWAQPRGLVWRRCISKCGSWRLSTIYAPDLRLLRREIWVHQLHPAIKREYKI